MGWKSHLEKWTIVMLRVRVVLGEKWVDSGKVTVVDVLVLVGRQEWVAAVLSVLWLWTWGWGSQCGDLDSAREAGWWSLVGSWNVCCCVGRRRWRRGSQLVDLKVREV